MQFAPLLEMEPKTSSLLEKLESLRTELVDLAFILEHKGRLDGADVAIFLSHRLSTLHEQILAEE